jgi:predicted ATPase
VEKISFEELDDHIFLVVDQMSRGSSLLSDVNEKDGLISLCIQAGQKAILSNDFKTAVTYFRCGIDQLSQTCWSDQYHLARRLYYAAAEAACSAGEFDLVEQILNDLHQNSRTLLDKIPAYSLQVYSVADRDRPQEAISLGLEILVQSL